jgi:hypothetical protein
VNSSLAFDRLTIEIGKKATAYRAFIAVWMNRGRGDVVIAAPTLEALRDRWEQITSCDLDEAMAQEVFICSVKAADGSEK